MHGTKLGSSHRVQSGQSSNILVSPELADLKSRHRVLQAQSPNMGTELTSGQSSNLVTEL